MTDVFPVVVGTDGSVRAAAAVTQAAGKAVLRDACLFDSSTDSRRSMATRVSIQRRLLTSCMPAKKFFRRKLTEIRKAFPSLDVSSDVIVADPAVVLVEESKKATHSVRRRSWIGRRSPFAARVCLHEGRHLRQMSGDRCSWKGGRSQRADRCGSLSQGRSNEAVEFAFTEARLRNKAVRVIQSQQRMRPPTTSCPRLPYAPW